MVVTVAPHHHLILLQRDKMDFQNITNTRTDLKIYFIERNKSIPTIYIKNLVKVFQSKVQLSSVIIQVKTCQLVVIQIHGGEGEFVVGGGRSGCGRGSGAAMKFVHRS